MNFGEEILINAGKKIVHNVFDQNRIAISPSVQWNDKLTIALTWSSQFAATSVPAHFKYTDVIWFQIKHKLDLRKKKGRK